MDSARLADMISMEICAGQDVTSCCPSLHVSAILTLSMQRLLLSKAQGRKDFRKPFKPCHVGIHRIALDDYSQMSTHVLGFQSFSFFLHHFVSAKLATEELSYLVEVSSIRYILMN